MRTDVQVYCDSEHEDGATYSALRQRIQALHDHSDDSPLDAIVFRGEHTSVTVYLDTESTLELLTAVNQLVRQQHMAVEERAVLEGDYE